MGVTGESRELWPIWGMRWGAAPRQPAEGAGAGTGAGAGAENHWEGVPVQAAGGDGGGGFLHPRGLDAPGVDEFLVLFVIHLASRRVEIGESPGQRTGCG